MNLKLSSRMCPNKLALGIVLACGTLASAQAPPADPTPAGGFGPIAIVPLDSAHPDREAKVTGALEVTEGKAMIAASGEVTAGSATTPVTLPRRGTLRVCASTSVKLAADVSVPAGEKPGLMMSLDHGAVELSLADSREARNADILLTPDFRILIGGSGAAEVKVRLGRGGDTCVDNPGADAPYVLVSSVFDGGAYRVQPGQRVMFQHGNLHEVVDDEKEPCGCPPVQPPAGNEFPLAQSEGLAPLPKPAPVTAPAGQSQPQITAPLAFNADDSGVPAPAAVQPPQPQPAAASQAAPASGPVATAAPKKTGFLHSIGRFFRRIFGAES
jgi:hypothetical protein